MGDSRYRYTKKELYDFSPQRSFKGDAREAAFLLGGIGTGNVSMGARGELRDWEIFNSPGKGNVSPYSFFAIRTCSERGRVVTKVLESKIHPPYAKAFGLSSSKVAGLPRMDTSTMRGEYPFVWIDFEDKELPVEVGLEAFTPFVPLNANDSGIPGAIIRYKVKNISEQPIDICIVGSLANLVGFDGYDIWRNVQLAGNSKNEYREEEVSRGLFYSSDLPSEDLQYGSMALMTSDKDVTMKTEWFKGGSFDGIQEFWDDFREDGRLEAKTTCSASGKELPSREKPKIGSLGIYHNLDPGEGRTFEFILAWHFPNRMKAWEDEGCSCGSEKETIRNYYGSLFKDAWKVGQYLIKNTEKLERASRDFHRALFSSTLPCYVIDAVASNITVLRSPTCFRIEDGTFLGWEGCHDTRGCCFGSCTHVWNYAQTVAFLFPELEQSMRKVEFNLETNQEGRMAFRSNQIFGKEKQNMLPAADGQLGTVIRLYREWKVSGNTEFLKGLWPKARKALDFAFSYWDSDGDFVLDAQQHNTYDIEFYGPNPLTNSLFYAALKAGAEMARSLQDIECAIRYENALKEGSRRMDELLWEGEYYIQKLDDINQYSYQHGRGCLSDQLLGQMLAHVTGLGYILPKNHVRKALLSIYKYNFRTSFSGHHNVQRTYVLNDEKGLLLCSWPKGGRPKLPFIYCDEVWTGIEYQVAAHLIYEGFIEEGLTMVKATRQRHDGYRRNPWNEVECGHHYARSMSSWALLLALSGFRFDMVEGTMSFRPVINKDNFSTFWSTGKAWGIYTQKKNPKTGRKESNVEVLYGNLQNIRVT